MPDADVDQYFEKLCDRIRAVRPVGAEGLTMQDEVDELREQGAEVHTIHVNATEWQEDDDEDGITPAYPLM